MRVGLVGHLSSPCKQQVKLLAKYEKNIKWLRAKRYGSFKPNMDTIINIELSPVQKELLCRGTESGIPPSNNRKEMVLTQFEMFHTKLMKNFTPVSENQRAIFMANLRAIA